MAEWTATLSVKLKTGRTLLLRKMAEEEPGLAKRRDIPFSKRKKIHYQTGVK